MAILLPALLATLAPGQEPVSFQKQIQPILSRQCVACHQPQSRQADLLLTTYDGFHESVIACMRWTTGVVGTNWIEIHLDRRVIKR
jgi:hypothetical protein